MLTEMRDTVPLILQSMGVNANDATKDDWLAAIDKLKDRLNTLADGGMY